MVILFLPDVCHCIWWQVEWPWLDCTLLLHSDCRPCHSVQVCALPFSAGLRPCRISRKVVCFCKLLAGAFTALSPYSRAIMQSARS